MDCYLFPMLSSDYKQKAKDISTTINWYVHLLATHQYTRYLSHSVADVGGYGRYSFLIWWIMSRTGFDMLRLDKL
ncbi:hypothetical protein [Moraxella bovis]|uniref:hypothetical protein n=1 Tax=Moraxella bovis TaxID=476 RepID=UPI0022271F81|nr:hypothetical protein [Moraxella bovis]UZA13122.1 hypothetical protein LP102_06670 [Moraxella bovis]UZA28539.1 hypothetical protein LP119_06185 [Moraxella bovis]UZA36946.1 hypothetical protein LP101_07010 [Moraxella bovis]WAJ74721.1 hypothetical protein LP095_06120 [Moraxella bovis]